MQCTNCGHELMPGSEFCGNCGAKLIEQAAAAKNTSPESAPAEASAAESPEPNPVPAATASAAEVPAPVQQTAYAVPKQQSSGLSIASMVLGIISIISMLLWFIAAPLGILALIFGFIGRGKGGKGMALAGIITGAIGLVGSIVIISLAVAYTQSHTGTSGSSYRSTMELIQYF